MSEELTVQEVQSCIINLPDRVPFMLDKDLAVFYETETKYVNRAVKRNLKRFPEDFCFQLSDGEVEILRCQIGTAISRKSRTNPYGFTREGANMLCTVLHTEIAIDRSIQIMRAFSAIEKLRHGVVELAEQFEACKRMAEASGLRGNQAILSAGTLLKELTGWDPLEILNQRRLTCEPQEVHLSPTAIGKMIGLSPRKANALLETAGLQEAFRDAKDRKCWKPTEKGKPFAVLKDTGKKHADGRPVQQLMWLESVVAFLKDLPSQAEFAF